MDFNESSALELGASELGTVLSVPDSSEVFLVEESQAGDEVALETSFGLESSASVPFHELEEQELFGSEAVERDIDLGPSVVSDFSALLPEVSQPEASLDASYNPEDIVQSAWKSLKTQELKLPWEEGFWSKFLDPNVTAMDMLSENLKRPFPIAGDADVENGVQEVDRRVVSKTCIEITGYMKHIRDIPERTWKEEREATWEIAIRRWVALLDQWEDSDSLLLQTLKVKGSFSEKAQILVDVFFNKAPQTLMKRVNSLSKIVNTLAASGISFPCSESDFYAFLKCEAQRDAPATRLKACFEAVTFAKHVLNIESLHNITVSRRCLGAASSKGIVNPKQADPFTVEQLGVFHEVLRAGGDIWDKAMAGMLLFCTYARSRWSDAQHGESLLEDRDFEGTLCHVEISSSVHKTARALHLRHMFLPLAAPATGVSQDNWGEQWLEVRKVLGIEDFSTYPLMPAPSKHLTPTKRPLSTSEAKHWIAHLLGSRVSSSAKLTSHSCKCTCLSFLAKRGANFEDRLMLGYHSNKMRVGLTYSRDSVARPLALLAHVLKEIRMGIFEPDNSRSGRLKSGAIPLSSIDALASVSSGAKTDLGDATRDAIDLEANKRTDQGSLQSGQVEQPEQQEDHGHITTDSSDSSSQEDMLSPVVGHHLVELPPDKRLWLNHNSKMFHLSRQEHNNILLCGRRVTAGFRRHEGSVRFDSAKCRACFRLKES